jgi:hypothetical protein
MRSEQLAQEIAGFERDEAALRTKLDAAVAPVGDYIVRATSAWINYEVQSRITALPGVVQSLGIERLRGLKAKVAALLESIPALVAAELSQKHLWPHATRTKKASSQRYEEGYFPTVIRNVISKLGGVLDEFGLLVDQKGGSYPAWKQVSPGEFRYGINPGFDLPGRNGEKDGALSAYSALLSSYWSVTSEITKRREEYERTKAKEMWESA